jgi:hypothetical protein
MRLNHFFEHCETVVSNFEHSQIFLLFLVASRLSRHRQLARSHMPKTLRTYDHLLMSFSDLLVGLCGRFERILFISQSTTSILTTELDRGKKKGSHNSLRF